MTRWLPAAACCALASVALPATAQDLVLDPNGATVQMRLSAPGNNAPEPTGTGRIRGRVVDAENGAALRDTMLQLSGGGLRQGRTVGTDDEGRYEFENLPAGRFNLSANKPGYMTLAFGQRRAFESGKPIELADKQTLDTIDFAVPRGGVIVARVMDENGDPIANVRVIAQRYRFANGQRVLTQVSPVYQGTDDRGEVRVFGLPPGEYYVSSTMSTAISAAAKGTTYMPTFFPGTPSVDAAQRVAVQVGKEVSVSFQLLAARRSRVSGSVRRADGTPAVRSSVVVVPRTGGQVFSNVVQPDGTFAFPEIAPGEYTVQSSFAGAQPSEREQGIVPITVSGADVTGVVVTLAKGGRVRGRVSFDTPAPANVRLSSLRPIVTATVAASGAVPIGAAPNTQDDGTFVIDSVFTTGMVRVGALPTGWFLKSVTAGGRDITDTPITVEGGNEIAGVEVVLTQSRAELNGSAADAKGAPVSDYTVIVFPEDKSQWTMGSRFLASARPDQQGRFKMTGLPPGKYLAAAVDYVEAGAERDPELFDRLRERATAVTVGDGEAKTLMLTVQ